MQLGQKVISATLILSGLTAFGRALDLLSILLVARLIAPDAFGIVAAALIVMQLTASITEINISDALIQKTSLTRADLDTGFTFGFLRGVVITVFMLAVAHPTSIILDLPDLAPVIMALSIAPAAISLSSPRTCEYMRRVEPAIPAITVFISRLIGFIVTIGIAYQTRSYWAIPMGLITCNVFIVVSSYVIAPYRPRFSFESARWLFSFAGWMNLFSMTNAGMGQYDRFYIGTSLGHTILGIYTIATSISIQLMWSIAAPIMNALFAGLASVKEDLDRLRRGFLRSQQILVATMMPIGVGVALVADPLVMVILGPEWQMAAIITSIVAPAAAFQMMSVGAHALGLALGQPKKLFLQSLISFLVLIPLVAVGVLFAGVEGASLARAAALVLLVMLNLRLVDRLIGLSIIRQFKNCMRTFVSCLVMSATVLIAQELLNMFYANTGELIKLSILVSVGAITYVVAHGLIWKALGYPDGPEALVARFSRIAWNQIR